ncbi:MAG: hypothetical protein HQ506_03245 [Candidatus Marinimicrobia bacterium]|nr:hypothetical protein [Candidatus Neomarinimicrobiota bacterium]
MMKLRNNISAGVLMMFMFSFIMTCESLDNPFLEDLPSDGLGNATPETHLFLTFAPDRIDTVLSDTTADTTFIFTRHMADTTTSFQVMHWWGEDPDGEVVAYHYRWNFEDTWTRTMSETDTFFLPLQIAYDEFLFEVKAEDNLGALDPSPATLRIPVANSRPEIEFANSSNPTAGNNPNVTHVTYPTRTFAWSVSDIDGLETINQIRFRLDTTSNWNYRPGNVSSVTLTDIPPGEHTFFVQAIDTAGAFSNLLQFPDSTDNASPNGWRVVEPVGDILLIDDYKLDDGSTHTFYTEILDSLVGMGNYSELELGFDEKALPGATTDQLAMFNYFKTVVWYHYSEAPSLSGADGALRTYLEAGGNVFISSIFIDTDYTFTSIDSNWVVNPSGRMITGLDINMVDLSVTDSTVILPSLSLKTSSLIARRVSAYYPANLIDGETSQDLFVLQDARNSNDAWTGNPPVAQLFTPSSGSGQSIFFSLPLHLCDGNENIIPIMDYLLFEVFE